jgi:hypothetical protein
VIVIAGRASTMLGNLLGYRGFSVAGGIPGWRIRWSPASMLRFALSSG